MISAITKSRFFSTINPQTLLFFFHNFFINVGTTLVYVSSNILLLENHPESSLPLAYIAAALAVMVAGQIYEHYEHHLVLEKLSLGTMLSSLFMVLVVMILLWAGHGMATAIAIMVGYRIIYLLINLEFWGLSAIVFDVRQSKRLFSVIGSGDMPAKALGAVLAVIIHSPSVLMILLGVSLVCFAIAFYTQKLTFKYTDIPNPHHARPRQSGLSQSKFVQKYFSGNRLLTALCLGTIAIAAAATWIEYHFFVNVKYKFHSQHDTIIFIGSLLTATYVISTFVKLLFSGKIVERFGVKLTLYLLPLTTVFTSLGLIVSSYFRTDEPSLLVYYCIAYLLFELVRRTLFDPVFLVFFQPLSTKNRLKGHTLAKGFYEPLGMLIAGILLWVIYTMKWSNIGLTFDLSLFFSLAALLIFRKAYGEYVLELKSAISKRFLKSGEMASPGEALPIIRENLKSEKKEEVINAIAWLVKNKPNSFSKNADFLLKNPSELVRLKTLEALVQTGKYQPTESFYDYIENETDTPSQTLAVQIAAASESLTSEKLEHYLSHNDLDIVRGAVMGARQSGKSPTLLRQTINDLFLSPDENARLTALDCVENVDIEPYRLQIKNALKQDNLRIQKRAIEVIGTSGDKAMVHDIQPFLTGSLSKTTSYALVKSGETGTMILLEWLNRTNSQKDLLSFLKAAEKQPNPAILPILFNLLTRIYQSKNKSEAGSPLTLRVHTAALRTLTHYVFSEEYKVPLNEFLEVELSHAYQILSATEDGTENQIWQSSLQYELQQTNQRLFHLFMLLYDKDSVQNAWKGIKHASQEKRANSLEMIESLLPRELYPSLRALFEDIPLNRKLEALRQYLNLQDKPLPFISYVLTQKERYFTSWTIALAIEKWSPQNTEIVKLDDFAHHPVRLLREAVQRAYLKFPNYSFSTTALNTMKHAENTQQISEMERVIVLKNTKLFSQTPENVLSSIAPIMKEVMYQEGQEIFAKGDPGDSMFIIYSGEIGIYDGPKQLALFDKGEIFGELALLDTEPRSASTVAESDVLLFRVDQEDFFELMEERDEILRNVLRILCQRIRVQNEKMRATV
ncbi:cyclic nucleotide-binding domain-containing protein [Dyadobacter subterraneus]|uniref:Cyclic nucleotide-binding domain-containing protein n=1 Tax=Dyadobacter subterraneus TaxID=2773304 RepID=A0ABR9WBT1_9BACT|nr:cyclic nucleotide-binding domain-containing protein [Dyadobacter subterraneus]MBE9462941.1 cyclic nucleotide-binding domain-containing protein [Dyadobacter subterraneus]